jgi:hypothetical protein
MPIELTEHNGGRILELIPSGKLTDQDYRRVTAEFDRLVKEHGKIRVLVNMNQLEGWEARAAWDDLVLAVRHYNDFERLAMVGGEEWHGWAAAVFQMLSKAKIRCFSRFSLGQARAWVTEDSNRIEHGLQQPTNRGADFRESQRS